MTATDTKQLAQLERLIQSIDVLPDPTAQTIARDLVQALFDVYGSALERMLEITYEAGASGQTIIDTLAQDELVGHLLLLHGLHPLSLESRVLQALEKVRPYMRSHGGNIELLDVTDDGVVKLRLDGSCHGCASSHVTLKYAVEEAIYAVAPDVMAIETEGAIADPPRPQGFIPVTQLLGERKVDHDGDSWIAVEGLASLIEGALRTLEVSGLSILFCRLGDSYYAYGNICPNCGQLLGQAKLAGKDLVCTACEHRYDVMRAGRDLDDPSLHLEPFPLLQDTGRIKIALHTLQV